MTYANSSGCTSLAEEQLVSSVSLHSFIIFLKNTHEGVLFLYFNFQSVIKSKPHYEILEALINITPLIVKVVIPKRKSLLPLT